jgi:hypothetical protein
MDTGYVFFQKHWPIIDAQIRGAILNFLNLGIFDPDIYFTYIALISKNDLASNVSEFRPISLCNILHKLMAKTLANKLKLILPKVITQNQSAFLPGCLISDNILVAYEALHTMDTRLKGEGLHGHKA